MTKDNQDKKELTNLRIFTLLIMIILFGSLYILNKYGKPTSNIYTTRHLNERY